MSDTQSSTVGLFIRLPVVDLGPEGVTDLWVVVWTTTMPNNMTRLYLRRGERRQSDANHERTLDVPREEAQRILGTRGEFHFTGWVEQ